MEQELVLKDLIAIALEHGEDIPVMFSADDGENYEKLSRASVEIDGIYIGAKTFFAEPMSLGELLGIAAECDTDTPIIVHKPADDFGGAVYAVEPQNLEGASYDDGVVYMW